MQATTEMKGMTGSTGMTGTSMMDTGTGMDKCAKMCMDASCMMTKMKIACAMKGETDMEMMNMMMDCKEILFACAEFCSRGSMCHAMICKCCADICDKMCTMCEKKEGKMKDCCEMLRKCSEMCNSCANDTTGKMSQEYKQKIMECCQ